MTGSDYQDFNYGDDATTAMPVADEGAADELTAAAETAGPASTADGTITRRKLLQGLGAAGAVGAGAWWQFVHNGNQPQSAVASKRVDTSVLEIGSTDAAQTQSLAAGDVDDLLSQFGVADNVLLTPAPIDQRVLVLIELEGGNDGLSTVVPYATGAYYDRRPNLSIAPESVIPIDSEVGLNPQLARLSQRQVAVVEGVGPVNGNLSHFEMVERWDYGSTQGGNASRAGFLARVVDRIDAGSPVTGLSVAGHTPRFTNASASTLSIENLNALKVLTQDDWIYPIYRQSLASVSGGPVANTLAGTWGQLFSMGRSLQGDIERYDGDSPIVKNGGGLGRQLAMAAALIKADLGIRVVHARMGGFDTHDGHNGRHERLMGQLDGAVDGFLQILEDAGLADRVLVATTSEFGRRVSENASGLDHGAASTMLLFGPVAPGRVGDPSPVSNLDDRGNLKTTIGFDRYLASLAQEWLGVDAGAVLDNAPAPISILA